MSVDIHLFLQNVQAALANQQYQYAQFLLAYAITLAKDETCPSAQAPFDVSIGLHQGRIRRANEDCVLVVQGVTSSREPFGLFVVCDGMGGHERGQEAAHLAIQTMLEYVLPRIEKNVARPPWEHLFDGIQHANRAIYQRNQDREQAPGSPVIPSALHHMGTTVTAVLLFREVAYIANVGDSRTYLYGHAGLRKITKDHSLVAQKVAHGLLNEEDLYTHPQRNQITRALGTHASVEVDTFVCPLQPENVLLLCSDGLWEMTRDLHMAAILASWTQASNMAQQLVHLANEGGGDDNIGCVVVHLQPRTESHTLPTTALDPIDAVARLTAFTPASL